MHIPIIVKIIVDKPMPLVKFFTPIVNSLIMELIIAKTIEIINRLIARESFLGF